MYAKYLNLSTRGQQARNKDQMKKVEGKGEVIRHEKGSVLSKLKLEVEVPRTAQVRRVGML
jgi:hypothetical protein